MTTTAFPLIALPLFSESFDLIPATKQSAYLRNEYSRGKPFTFPIRCMELFFILRRLWWLEGKLSDYSQNGRECQIVPGVPIRVLSLCISLGLHISKLLIVWKKICISLQPMPVFHCLQLNITGTCSQQWIKHQLQGHGLHEDNVSLPTPNESLASIHFISSMLSFIFGRW